MATKKTESVESTKIYVKASDRGSQWVSFQQRKAVKGDLIQELEQSQEVTIAIRGGAIKEVSEADYKKQLDAMSKASSGAIVEETKSPEQIAAEGAAALEAAKEVGDKVKPLDTPPGEDDPNTAPSESGKAKAK